jgi:hypothetical protein
VTKHHHTIRKKSRCAETCGFRTRDKAKFSVHLRKYGHTSKRPPESRNTKVG